MLKRPTFLYSKTHLVKFPTNVGFLQLHRTGREQTRDWVEELSGLHNGKCTIAGNEWGKRTVSRFGGWIGCANSPRGNRGYRRRRRKAWSKMKEEKKISFLSWFCFGAWRKEGIRQKPCRGREKVEARLARASADFIRGFSSLFSFPTVPLGRGEWEWRGWRKKGPRGPLGSTGLLKLGKDGRISLGSRNRKFSI